MHISLILATYKFLAVYRRASNRLTTDGGKSDHHHENRTTHDTWSEEEQAKAATCKFPLGTLVSFFGFIVHNPLRRETPGQQLIFVLALVAHTREPTLELAKDSYPIFSYR